MAFYETPRLSERISYGARGGPEWDTTVVVTRAGVEYRDQALAYPRERWDVAYGVKSMAECEALRNFFLTMRGRTHGFRFKNWSDFECPHSAGVVTALTSTTFAMLKRYASGAQSCDRRIFKPVAGSVEVRVSGIVTAHTVNTVTGVLTIASAPAAGDVTWSGEHDVPMRFDTDRFDASIISRNLADGLLHEWSGVPVVELLRP